jgi:uncharacterized membrane protein YdjX (TVP38/TMEM64 family)
VWWAGRSLVPRVLGMLTRVDSLGPAAPIVFILIYAAAIVALVPSTPLTLAAGAIFGVVQGVTFAFIGSTIGSTAAFLIGRNAARPLVERRLAATPRLAAIERAVSVHGRRIVFLLRLSPVVPFNFLNYALGVTTISAFDFILAGIGSIPGEIMYAYWGRVSGEALALAEQAEVPRSASYYGFLVAGLVATLAATILVTRTARRALRDV